MPVFEALHVGVMKIIYANIVWFAVLVFGLFNAAFARHNSDDWNNMQDVRLNYDFLYGGVAVLLIVAAVGLLLRKKWGYNLAKSLNCTMVLFPVSLFVATLIATPELGSYEAFKINIQSLGAGVVSMLFWVCLFRADVKTIYVQ